MVLKRNLTKDSFYIDPGSFYIPEKRKKLSNMCIYFDFRIFMPKRQDFMCATL